MYSVEDAPENFMRGASIGTFALVAVLSFWKMRAAKFLCCDNSRSATLHRHFGVLVGCLIRPPDRRHVGHGRSAEGICKDSRGKLPRVQGLHSECYTSSECTGRATRRGERSTRLQLAASTQRRTRLCPRRFAPAATIARSICEADAGRHSGAQVRELLA